jgi:purine nucleoside permease
MIAWAVRVVVVTNLGTGRRLRRYARRIPTTAMEDHGVIHALQLLAKDQRVDIDRLLVLRTASNYSGRLAGSQCDQRGLGSVPDADSVGDAVAR